MSPLGKKKVVCCESRVFGSVTAVEYENAPGKVFIHCEITEWSIRSAKECLIIWPDFVEILALKGYKEIYSCVPDNDSKLLKWQRKFGLEELNRVGGAVIFRRSIRNGN